jgi:phage gp29-like protein
MMQAMDRAISKIILSQTMTTDDGSSLSQAQVHQGVADKVIKADADLLCESFNRSIGAWFTEFNFPGAIPPRVWRNTEPPEDLAQRAERDTKIKALGYEPTEDYIAETYGDGWVKAQAASTLAPVLPPDMAAQDFAEVAALAAVKSINRADQQALVQAAEHFAGKYQDVIGGRVAELLSYAEDSGDYQTFRRRITELMASAPSEQTVEKVRRATLMARLLGAFRAQK